MPTALSRLRFTLLNMAAKLRPPTMSPSYWSSQSPEHSLSVSWQTFVNNKHVPAFWTAGPRFLFTLLSEPLPSPYPVARTCAERSMASRLLPASPPAALSRELSPNPCDPTPPFIPLWPKGLAHTT